MLLGYYYFGDIHFYIGHGWPHSAMHPDTHEIMDGLLNKDMRSFPVWEMTAEERNEELLGWHEWRRINL